MLNTLSRRTVPTTRGSRPWICETCLRSGSPVTRRSFSQQKSARRPLLATLRPSAPTSIPQRQYAISATSGAPKTTRNKNLPTTPARTRFAPSPTGQLHIGGLRTALYSYLLAKRTGGQFILRIEDTDQKRLVPGAEKSLLYDLRWAGLEWDEGPDRGGEYGPYKQSERNHIYQSHAKTLLNSGKAYRCFCQPKAADVAMDDIVTSECYQDCSSNCLEHSNTLVDSGETPFTIRLKQVSNQSAELAAYPDLVYGNIPRLKTQAGHDRILLKSDGTPTYHFANVVDDHLMRITHVIRGAEWMASTPLHYDLYRAFGWTPPAFAHVPLLTDLNGAKLSKRNAADIATDLETVRKEQDALPEQLANFLLFLGWSNSTQDDFMTMGDMITNFDLKFTKGDVKVSYGKLRYLGRKHVAHRCYVAKQTGSLDPLREDLDRLTPLITAQYRQISERCKSPTELDSYVARVLTADKGNWKTSQSFVDDNCYFWAFDSGRVPAEPESMGKEPNVVHYSTIAEATQNLLRTFDVKQEFRKPLYALPDPTVPKKLTGLEKTTGETMATFESTAWKLEEIAAKTMAAIEYTAWKLTFPDAAEQDLPFTNQSFDAEAYARHFGGDESSVKRKKAMSAAVNQYLRQKLSYGLRGPKIGLVLEILGYEECCKRVGVRPSGPGW